MGARQLEGGEHSVSMRARPCRALEVEVKSLDCVPSVMGRC